MYHLQTKKIKDAFQFIADTAFEMTALINDVENQQQNFRAIALNPGTNQSEQEPTDMSYFVREGCVSRRKDKRYVARLYLFGKQRQIAIGKNKKDVIDRLNEIVDLKRQRKITSLEEFNLYLESPFALKRKTEPAVEAFTFHKWARHLGRHL